MVAGDDLRTSEIAFGPFCLKPAERLLEKGDEPVPIGARALDILIALVGQAGHVVGKRELLERVWPDVIVEEASLRIHIAALRKVLGDGRDGARYISNVHGRGYCFVAPLGRHAMPDSPAPTAVPVTSTKPRSLPALLTRMVGRDETINALCSLVKARPLVTIVGPGGIGKTTVAVAVGHALIGQLSDEVCFVDLGSLSDPALVASTVSSALGCPIHTRDPILGLLAFLADKQLLLLLDNCEHLIEAVAALTERLLREASFLHVLATSREPLRIEDENVHVLLPLETPRLEDELTAEQALASPAVQLFMDRAAASGHRFDLTDADAPIVARMCHRLDGIALAIEVVASRAGVYGIRGTADLLDNRFKLVWQGRRSALPRHKTLQAMLDWSYNLLSDYEQAVLRRLSVFVGHFMLDSALVVASDGGADESWVAAAIASLVDKSLVWISDRDGSAFYRLPDTARIYAAAKLADSGEMDVVLKRHANHFAGLLEMTVSAVMMPERRELSASEPHLGNIRAALEWSFSGTGDAAIGAELAARSSPLFLGLRSLASVSAGAHAPWRHCRRLTVARNAS